jgi:quercetin dioxygenase-like cupin family protein
VADSAEPAETRTADAVLRLENRRTGEILCLRRLRGAGGDTVLVIDGSLPPRAKGPPPHIHFRASEEGTVTAGLLGARVGNKTILVPVGGTVAFPAGVVHAWWNAGDEVLELSGRSSPAGDLDRYLQAIFAVVNANPSGPPSVFYLAHVAWRHRRSQAFTTPPRAIQRILFPVILGLGYAMGKYRGADWPGSPASCPGVLQASV